MKCKGHYRVRCRWHKHQLNKESLHIINPYFQQHGIRFIATFHVYVLNELINQSRFKLTTNSLVT